MENLAFYKFYNGKVAIIIRLVILIILLCALVLLITQNQFPRIPVFLLIIFLMVEIYFAFYINRYTPKYTVYNNKSTDTLKSSTLRMLELFSGQKSAIEVIRLISQDDDHKHFLYQLGITPEELTIDSGESKLLLMKANDLVKLSQGKYITTLDYLTAYLTSDQITEEILQKKELRREDVIAYATIKRNRVESMQAPPPFRINFRGEGFAESLAYGWTPATLAYTTDFTSESLNKKVYRKGRDKEYEFMINALSKSENNNIILVGNIGVGKEALIDCLIQDSYKGLLPGKINHKRLLELNISSLIAGTDEHGELEGRLNQIIEEIAHSTNVILYIPEFQNILGSSDYNINLSGALLPHLKDGRLPIIASVSEGNYKQYIQKNPVREVFQEIEILEPDQNTSLLMLIDKSIELEYIYNCTILYNSIKAAIEHAHTYLVDEYLPGSAIKLLSQTASNLRSSSKKNNILKPEDVAIEVQNKTNVSVGTPSDQEKQVLLNMEDLLHQRVVDQVDAIRAISEGVRRKREGFSDKDKPLSFLFLGPTGVGKTETAKALAEVYYKNEENMIRLDMSEYKDTDGIKRLLGASPGEGEERGELTDKIHDKPYSLVLMDEFEKAHVSIQDLFLQVLDDGRLTDNKGEVVSFNNAIIIATSNAGSEYIREHISKGGKIDAQFKSQIIDYLQEKNIFKPELINRFDEVVVFSLLGTQEVKQITKLLLNELVSNLKQQDISLYFSEDVISKVATEGVDIQFGARPLRRYIQNNIEDLLAKLKLQDKIKRGDKVTIGVGSENEIIVDVT